MSRAGVRIPPSAPNGRFFGDVRFSFSRVVRTSPRVRRRRGEGSCGRAGHSLEAGDGAEGGGAGEPGAGTPVPVEALP